MDKGRDNPWTTRSSANRSSVSSSRPSDRQDRDGHTTPGAKRFGSISSSRNTTFGASGSAANNPLGSPTTGGSSAFGLGSGAFASFGSLQPDNRDDTKDSGPRRPIPYRTSSGNRAGPPTTPDHTLAHVRDPSAPWPLKNAWVIWYRPPTSKHSDYEKSTRPMCRMDTAQHFWAIYKHLKRPSALPSVSDYHFFKEGIRPVWEDEENEKGGKWVMKLKQGVADRYWEELLLAMAGDQFSEAGEEVCGAVVSVRSGEDVLSIWTKNDGGRNVKIRETIKRVLSLPADTNLDWRSHDSSMTQKATNEHPRHDKTQLQVDKHRGSTQEYPIGEYAAGS